MIIGDFEWSGTTIKQELGRVDRTGQLSSPRISVIHTGSPAEIKFVATAANRLKGVGAVSKGESESVGATALTDEFELGTDLDKLAWADAWARMPAQLKIQFIDKYFDDPTMEGQPKIRIEATAESFNKFMMGFQQMEPQYSRRVWEYFWDERTRLIESGAEDTERIAEKSRGSVLRTTELSDTLKLTEVLTEDGKKLGVVSGTLTPVMNRLKNIVSPYSDDWRRWISFYELNTNKYTSGLVVGPSHVKAIAQAFGRPGRWGLEGRNNHGWCLRRFAICWGLKSVEPPLTDPKLTL